ncbi:MAG: DUF2282 domain-containing protein [Rhodospirillaceae bacterium]
MSNKLTTFSLAAAVAGAVSMAAMTVPSTASAAGKEKCYGVAKAGENGCANAAGTHSCAGQATVSFDGGEWKLVAEGSCMEMGGKLEPFEGKSEEAEMKAG